MLYIERTNDHMEHTNELHLNGSNTKLFTANTAVYSLLKCLRHKRLCLMNCGICLGLFSNMAADVFKNMPAW